MERYVYRQTSANLAILPMLADRPVVTRPFTPFHLPSGEGITLYVSTPLWLQFSPGETPAPVQSVPIYRPPDTWFGPSTLSGELCYASQTHGRLALTDVLIRPHRAITPVLIRNQADSSLTLDRLNLPVPYLSLYVTYDGQLWTEPVTMTRQKDKDKASQISEMAPMDAQGASLLMPPRVTGNKNILARTFSTLFG